MHRSAAASPQRVGKTRFRLMHPSMTMLLSRMRPEAQAAAPVTA